MKVLNLYAGIGGNRKLWKDVEVTAVEYNPDIAALYQKFYPEDTVVVGDAHEYLIKHVQDGWDFIWASPPCPSHSRINIDGQRPPRYPDMKLYEEILMLGNNWYNGLWCIENVIPYYKPLVEPTVCIDRHLYWSNFLIEKIQNKTKRLSIADQSGGKSRFGFSLKGIKIDNKRQILRNLVDPDIGLHILNRARGIKTESKQLNLF